MSVKGTRTEKNLMAAFAGESQARNRYTYWAAQAKKEGYVQISNIFEETANHEKEHAKRLFKLMDGGEIEIAGAFPAGPLGTTAAHLDMAAAGEEHEYQEMYPEFAAIAREEGFQEIAAVFESIAAAEKMHGTRYRDLLKNLQEGTVFKKAEPVVWKCQNCGFITEGLAAPAMCPACAHPQAHFELLAQNW
jgi:rubrerythrin